MNTGNMMRTAMKYFQKNPQLLKSLTKGTKMFQRRRTNRGLTWVSILGIGTALGVMASRNNNIRQPVQSMMQQAKEVTGQKFNPRNQFATELAKEFNPDHNRNPLQ
ncbi:hypothetical protein GCM10008967_17050 [Bacillus carboniphilus]|uniref:YtxH domain-containing protein n=1 Tax=Bacillus carboniphilus TaxID=86663 RepID=A0ABN0W7A2_9BACI